MVSLPVIFALRAWHACVNPRFQRYDELLVRDRWSRAVGAGVPCPQDERIHFHVLDDCLPRSTAPVSRWIHELLADLVLRQAFPLHRQRCQVPTRYAWNEPVGRVGRLMARLARQGASAVAVSAADDQRLMTHGGIRLPWGVLLMAIHASRMQHHARNRIEQPRIRR